MIIAKRLSPILVGFYLVRQTKSQKSKNITSVKNVTRKSLLKNSMEVKIGDIYRHSKKGGTYKVLAIAKHSETLEDMVVYEALYENSLARVWARPVKMWEEHVEVNGEIVPRFVKV